MTKNTEQIQAVFQLLQDKIFKASALEDHSKQFDRLFFQWLSSELAADDVDRDEAMLFYFHIKYLLECLIQKKHPDDVKVFAVTCLY